jgi:hypothetical protein
VDLVAYAKAVAGNDPAATQKARAALLADADAYGSWLAGASKGQVRARVAAAGVRLHVQELMDQADAYAARDYQRAYRIERQAYEHMFTAGAGLAMASLTPEVAVGVETPPEQLRSAFAMLLGEHLELIVDAQRATFAGGSEFRAAAAQVNANTAALTKAMAGIVGPAKAAEFQSAWANHVEGLMAYTAAVAGNDQTAKTVAIQNLDGFAERLALYFSDIVKNVLAADPLTQVITAHDAHLINHVDAYAAKRYEQAQELELAGYQQMLAVANTLVSAIQRTVKPSCRPVAPRPAAAAWPADDHDRREASAGGRGGRPAGPAGPAGRLQRRSGKADTPASRAPPPPERPSSRPRAWTPPAGPARCAVIGRPRFRYG